MEIKFENEKTPNSGLSFKRGEIVACEFSGALAKSRPAVIIQSHLFNNTHSTITVCPITTFMINAPLFRVTVKHNKMNGLISTSQIMVDKMAPITTKKITKKVGQLNEDEMNELDKAVKLWLNLC